LQIVAERSMGVGYISLLGHFWRHRG